MFPTEFVDNSNFGWKTSVYQVYDVSSIASIQISQPINQ
jgi:hypothetical protein